MGTDLQRALAGIGSADERERDEAFAELLSLTMIFVRASMGRKLRDARESVDVCQSVAASLAENVRLGRVKFENEASLAGYLGKVVRTKLAMLARHDAAEKRGGGAGTVALGDGEQAAGREASASYVEQGREAYGRLIAALSDDEQELLRLRAGGMAWGQIADRTGSAEATLRQQFSRLQRRVAQELERIGE